jgi:hypothetical protein
MARPLNLPPKENSSRKRVLEFGTFLLALLTLGVTLAANNLPPLVIRLSQVSALVFVAYWVGPPLFTSLRNRAAETARFNKLEQQWPTFRARLKVFRSFFSHDEARSAFRAVNMSSGGSIVATDALREILSLLERLTSQLTTEAEQQRRWEDARRIVRLTEALIRAVDSTGIRSLMHESKAPLHEYFGALRMFRASYRDFAKEANMRIGETVFDES